MDTVDIPSETVPAEMKACEQILRRAKELKKAEPVVAYWCCFSAAQKALKVPNRSGEGTKWLMSLLDALEEMKAVLGANEAVTNEAAGAAYIENFALKVFMGADNEDRKGTPGKGTIRKFVVAGQFIEVLRCFENGMTEEMEQKLQYARWKAADGAKALREGRTPTSGPPLPEEAIDPFPSLPSDEPTDQSSSRREGSFSSLTRPTVSSGSPLGSGHRTPTNAPSPGFSRANLPSIDTSTSNDLYRTQSSSGAWSTVATPGLPDSEDGEPRFKLDAPQSKAAASDITTQGNQEPVNDAPKRNVRFTGPDGAPLSPATTFISTDSFDVPDAPPPTTFAPSPPKAHATLPTDDQTGRSRADSAGTLDGTPFQASNSQPTHTTSTASIPRAPSAATPSASHPSAPPAGLGLSSTRPSAPSAATLAGTPVPSSIISPATIPQVSAPPTRKQVEAVQKHARWAISALDFDDYETARSELRKALATLGG